MKILQIQRIVLDLPASTHIDGTFADLEFEDEDCRVCQQQRIDPAAEPKQRIFKQQPVSRV